MHYMDFAFNKCNKAPVSFHSWDQFTSKLEVRERFLKVFQYGSKFMSSFYGLSHKELSNAEMLCSSSRKAFRMFKSIESVHNIIAFQSNGHDLSASQYYLELVDHIFKACFFYYQNIQLLNYLHVLERDPKKTEFRGSVALLLSSLCSFLKISAKLYYHQAQLLQLKEQLDSRKCQSSLNNNDINVSSTSSIKDEDMCDSNHMDDTYYKIMATQNTIYFIQFVKSLCDLGVASKIFMNNDCNVDASTQRFHNSAVGLCGIVSSIIDLYQMWPSSV